MSKLAIALLIGVTAAGLGARQADAQEVGGRTTTIRAGGLMYDRGGDATNLMLGLGMDWTLSRHLLAEVEGSWSASDGVYYDYTGGSQFPQLRETSTHLATATAGLQAQALLGRVRPYVGLSAGLFVRYDRQPGGDRFVNTTFTVPAGIRLAVTDRFGVRGELRARFDTHQDGGSGTNIEQTIGITWQL